MDIIHMIKANFQGHIFLALNKNTFILMDLVLKTAMIIILFL